MQSPSQLFRLASRHLRMDALLRNAAALYVWEKDPGYANFKKSAEVCVRALEEAGFSDIEKIPLPADGVTTFMDHTMPQAWDRIGRCTFELLAPKLPAKKRLLCDSDRDPLEAGIWSPPTPKDGLVGEVVDGDAEGADVTGRFVFTREPPKNRCMIAWSQAGALGVVCTRMEAADVAPDNLCWMNGVGHYGWYYSKDDRRLPVFVLTPRRALFLETLLKKGPIRARGVMRTRIHDGVIHTVTGRIPGDSPEELVLLAHLYEPFLADDAVGFAGCVEAGRMLKQLAAAGRIRLRRSLRVVFSMERYGFFGFFSDPKRTRRIFAGQNMDGFCSKTYSLGGMPLRFFMSPVCNPFFGDVLQKRMLDTILPDVKYICRHSVLHDDSFGGDPDLGFPTLWIEEGTGKYHHNKHPAFNEIDEELTPRLLALITAYAAELLCAEPAELRRRALTETLRHCRERIREVRDAHRAGVIGDWEAGYRLKLARHFAEGRLRSLNRMEQGLVSEAEIQEAVAPVFARGWKAPEPVLPDLTPMEARADNMVVKRLQRGCIPFSLARVPVHERVLWPCATNRPVLPLSDGTRSLLEALRMQRYTESIPQQPFTKDELKLYIDFMRYLEKYGYVAIASPRKTSAKDFAEALKAVGVRRGMQMVVHTSLAPFGRFEGGPERYCRELQKAVGKEGTLMLPAFNFYDMSDTGGVFDWRDTAAKVGAAPECFRKMPGVLRSLDPTHSVSVWGRDKVKFIAHHHQVPAMHQDSPIGLLEQAGGYCLMVGCHTSVTFRHVVETSNGVRCCGQRAEEYPAILPDGTHAKLRAWAWMDGHCPAVNHEEIYGWLKRHGKLSEVVLGNCHLRLFRLADFRTAYERLLHGPNGCAHCTIRPRKNAFSVPSDWDSKRNRLKKSDAFTGDIDFTRLDS